MYLNYSATVLTLCKNNVTFDPARGKGWVSDTVHYGNCGETEPSCTRNIAPLDASTILLFRVEEENPVVNLGNGGGDGTGGIE